MPLPILSTRHDPSPADLLRLFLRTELHWSQHLGETTPLDAGTAIWNSQLNRVWDANCMLDAALPEGMSPEETVKSVEDAFASAGATCFRWTFNPSAPADRIDPLRRCLLDQGHAPHPADVMHLSSFALRSLETPPGLKIIPARASFRHARQIFEQSSRHWDEPQLIAAAELHLDDPHWDALLALRDGEPVGYLGVLAAGEIGRIDEVFVSPSARRQGIGRVLMNRAIEICARSLFKHVMLSVLPDNTAAIRLYEEFGFKKIGSIDSIWAGHALP